MAADDQKGLGRLRSVYILDGYVSRRGASAFDIWIRRFAFIPADMTGTKRRKPPTFQHLPVNRGESYMFELEMIIILTLRSSQKAQAVVGGGPKDQK